MKSSLQLLQEQLAPSGVLRAAINLSNPLLIKTKKPLTGVSPSLAEEIASRLQVPLQMFEYDHPDHICASLEDGSRPWDIALIAADPDRASRIDFTPAYCEIQATCIVPTPSTIKSFTDVDQEGVRVSVKGGGAYDLWVTRNWKKATIVRSKTLDDSYNLYIDEKLEALAGLRPRLLEDLSRSHPSPQHRILDGSFMAVQQSIGCLKQQQQTLHGDNDRDFSTGFKFLRDFVHEARQPGGIVERLIEEHEVTGRLSLPTDA